MPGQEYIDGDGYLQRGSEDVHPWDPDGFPRDTPPAPAQPNVCHCAGVTVAPLPVHKKYDYGCVFNQIRAEQRRAEVDLMLSGAQPAPGRSHKFWSASLCRCAQVFYADTGFREVLPHKPGEYESCRWHGRLTELDSLEEWAMKGAAVRQIRERQYQERAADCTFENEFTMNRGFRPNDWLF